MDRSLNDELAADVSIERHADRVGALHLNRALRDDHVAADIASFDADAVVAENGNAAAVLERTRQRPFKDNAARLISLDSDGAGVCNWTCVCSEHMDAEAVRALREQAVVIAIIVTVGWGYVLVDGDRTRIEYLT